MAKYKAQWDYASSYGAFHEGAEVELDPEEAEVFNRDSPGVLRPVQSTPLSGEGRAMSSPLDRMDRGGSTETRAPVEATDAAIELAEKHGIDLAEVAGTGVDGRVLVGDVEALVESD